MRSNVGHLNSTTTFVSDSTLKYIPVYDSADDGQGRRNAIRLIPNHWTDSQPFALSPLPTLVCDQPYQRPVEFIEVCTLQRMRDRDGRSMSHPAADTAS